MSSLGVVPDGVASAAPNPVGDGAVLPALLGSDLLDLEGLVGRHPERGAKQTGRRTAE